MATSLLPSAMSLDEIDAFLAVARAGSFIGAGRQTAIPVSTLSRRVSVLERKLGVQLIRRSTRALALTNDGQAFAERCGAAMAEIMATVCAVRDKALTLRGPLRVSAPQYACNDEFGPLLIRFAAMHPELELDLRLTNGALDLIEENMDLAFQLTPLPTGSQIARRLWSVPYILCASDEFLKLQADKAIQHPRDLLAAPCVITPPIENWAFEHPSEGSIRVGPRRLGARVDDLGLGLRAVLEGLGYGFLPRGLAKPFLGGGLVEVNLSEWRAEARDLYAVYPPSRQLSPKVRALIDFALQARAMHP